MFLRQSTASQEISFGPFLDDTDGNTEENGLTIANTDVKIRKGGTIVLVNKNSGGLTNISNGVYYATLDATDTNTLGKIEIYVHVAGALAVKNIYTVLPVASYDALITNGLNDFDPAADTVANVTLVATTTTNTDMVGTNGANTVVPPSVAQFNARTILSADYFDPAADTVANVTLVATTTTNTDMRGTDGANTTTPPTTAQIWAETTRVLTSGVNIVLAKGVGLTGLNDIAATAIVTGGAITTSSGVASVDTVKVNGATVLGAGTAANLWRGS